MTDTISLPVAMRSANEIAVSGPVHKRRQPVPAIKRLTPRQHEILHLLARGFYYKEIGAALGISHCTVRAHLHAAYQKMSVKSRALAVIKFQEHARQEQS